MRSINAYSKALRGSELPTLIWFLHFRHPLQLGALGFLRHPRQTSQLLTAFTTQTELLTTPLLTLHHFEIIETWFTYVIISFTPAAEEPSPETDCRDKGPLASPQSP